MGGIGSTIPPDIDLVVCWGGDSGESNCSGSCLWSAAKAVDGVKPRISMTAISTARRLFDFILIFIKSSLLIFGKINILDIFFVYLSGGYHWADGIEFSIRPLTQS